MRKRMFNRPLFTLALLAALGAGSAGAETSERGTETGRVAQGPAAMEPAERSGEPQGPRQMPASESTDLSNLAILALGSAGLIWVRRHVAEL